MAICAASRSSTAAAGLFSRSMDEMSDPDSRARTHLANERTFLAWLRTGLTLVAFGLVGAQLLALDIRADFVLVRVLPTAAVATGMLLVLVGAQRYLSGQQRIDEAVFRPAHASVLVASAIAVVAGLVAVVIVWLLPST
jgi:putative membrane protein